MYTYIDFCSEKGMDAEKIKESQRNKEEPEKVRLFYYFF